MKNGKKNNIPMGLLELKQNGTKRGTVFGLGIGSIEVELVPQSNKEGTKTYSRIFADPDGARYPIGAAFPRKTDEGQEYESVAMDSPMLPAPVNAGLFRDKQTGLFNLVWSRPEEEGAAPKAEATLNFNLPAGTQVEALPQPSKALPAPQTQDTPKPQPTMSRRKAPAAGM